jgi:hypothetical protein
MLADFLLTFCSRSQVRGYPTLKVIHQGEEVKAYRGEQQLHVSCMLDKTCRYSPVSYCNTASLCARLTSIGFASIIGW